MVENFTKLKNDLTLSTLSGSEARKYFQQIASMRINMFKGYPYFYEGSFDCEKEYLESYFNSTHSKVLLVLKDEQIVGFSTSIPLKEMEVVRSAFSKKQIDTSQYLYIGETLIEEPFRTPELLRKISEFHEAQAKNTGYSRLVCMVVKRDHSHPLRPANYRALEPVQDLGYKLLEEIEVKQKWERTDTHQREENCLDIWTKPISNI